MKLDSLLGAESWNSDRGFPAVTLVHVSGNEFAFACP